MWVLHEQALVPDQRPAVDKHFNAIASELLRELGGRLWRVREACCLALSDLFQVCSLASEVMKA